MAEVKLRLTDSVKLHFLYPIKGRFMVSPMSLGKMIRNARNALRPPMTQEALADIFGISKQAVLQWEKDRSRPDQDKIGKLAKVLNIPAANLLDEIARGGVNQQTNVDSTAVDFLLKTEQPLSGSTGGFALTELPLSDRNLDMPLYRVVRGGKGEPILESQAYETASRPDYLEKVRNPYGVMVEGDSMLPEWRPGWVAHVNPNIYPVPGETCIFRGERADGSQIALIKVLRKETATTWLVEQHNPPKTFELKKSDYQVAHVVVGQDRRRR